MSDARAGAGRPMVVRADIRLQGMSVQTGRAWPPAPGIEVRPNHECSHRIVSAADCEVGVRVSHRVDAAPVFRIELDVLGVFTFDAVLDARDVHSPEVAERLAAACLPYCAEIIAYVTGRAGLPPLIVARQARG